MPVFSSGPSQCIHYVPGGASLGRKADGGKADDAGAVASADDCASSTSHAVAVVSCLPVNRWPR